MAYCYQIEYYVYEGDDAVAWVDDYSEALSYCGKDAVTKIEKVMHYLDDHETMWERD